MNRFLLLLTMFFAGFLGLAPPVSAADRVALVIGNSDYAAGSVFPDLRLAAKDARLVSETLETLGFEVIFAQDVSKQAIYTRLLEFEKAIEEGGTALFYFAGHGVEFEKKNYLAGSNAIFRDRDLLFEEAMDADIVISKMLGAGPKTAMVFLDCCRESPPQSWVMSLKKTRGINTVGLAPMQTRPGLVVGFAASAGNLANDFLSGENGPFASALTKHMKTGAEISEVLKLTGRDVNRLSIEMKQRNPDQVGIVIQEPAVYGQIYHDFYFSPDGIPRETEQSKVAEMEQQIAVLKKLVSDLEKAGTENKALREQLAAMELALDSEKRETPVEPETMARTEPDDDPSDTKKFGYSGPGSMSGGTAGKVRTFGGIEFVWCPPTGSNGFLMGSPESEEGHESWERRHRVVLTKGFWMAKTECTQAQWLKVMGSNPSRSGEKVQDSEDLPVESVSWYSVQDWLAGMNSRFPLPKGWKWSLPTEAQWEYACRAGTETVYHFGDDASQLYLYGNFADRNVEAARFGERAATQDDGHADIAEVGSYQPNKWGLHDMHGNVLEWCHDFFDEDYYEEGQVDPQGPDAGESRVFRSSSFDWGPELCRVALRGRVPPEGVGGNMGFRPAIVPVQ